MFAQHHEDGEREREQHDAAGDRVGHEHGDNGRHDEVEAEPDAALDERAERHDQETQRELTPRHLHGRESGSDMGTGRH